MNVRLQVRQVFTLAVRLLRLKGLAVLLFTTGTTGAQHFWDEDRFLAQLDQKGALPESVLKGKTVVLHSYIFTENELALIQEYFQKTGIDAVAYYPLDMVTAGKDVSKAFSEQLLKREVTNLAIATKSDAEYKILLTVFNGKETIINPQQPSWIVTNAKLEEALKGLQRSSSLQFKRQNLLINDTPEPGMVLDPIMGKRNEFFAVDMKVDLVAVPKFGDEAMDKELEQLMTENFPFKFKMTEPNVSEKELRKQGMLYVLCFVHTRAKIAKQLLGYTPGRSETAIASVTYPEGQPQLKNIAANTTIYKVYFKHIDSGNIFLGNKWDADLTWQSALLNNIRGMKAELRLN